MSVCECVQRACECVCERDDRRVCCTVGAECQMVSVSEYYPTMCSLVAVKREGILSLDYATTSLTHTYTHIPTHSYSRTCSLAKPTSLNPACTSPSVCVLGGLGCRLLSDWTELSGKCPSIGCCQLVKFFCYHGCRVSCPNVSQCI